MNGKLFSCFFIIFLTVSLIVYSPLVTSASEVRTLESKTLVEKGSDKMDMFHLLTYFHVSPYINTGNVKIIAPLIKKINIATIRAIQTVENAKIYYVNSYGSTFVPNDNIPNNFVQEINIHLGDFAIDETLYLDTSNQINNKINKFRTNFYLELKKINNDFIFNKTLDEFKTVEKKNEQIIKKELQDMLLSKNDISLFSDNGNIYIEDIPIMLYSSYKSGKHNKSFYREIFLPINYTVSLYNKNTGEKKQIKIVPIGGDKTQAIIDVRYFAPNIYTNKSPTIIVKNVQRLDGEKYFEVFLQSFGNHLSAIKGYYLAGNQIKFLKRMLQLSYIIKPLLQEEDFLNVTTVIKNNLNSPSVIFLNEYKTIFGNACEIIRQKNLRSGIPYAKFEENHFLTFRTLMQEIASSNVFTFEEKEKLKNYEKILEKKIKDVYKENSSEINYEDIQNLKWEVFAYVNELSFKAIKNYNVVTDYYEKYNNMLDEIGYKKVSFVPISKNEIGFFKSDLPANFDERIFSDRFFENKYVFLKEEDKDKYKDLSKSVWVNFGKILKDNDSYYLQAKKLIEKDKIYYGIKTSISYF